jgi:hypothetical protein
MQCRNTWFKKKSQSLYIRKQHYVDLLFYLFWRLSYSDILYIYGLFIIEVHIMCCDIVCVCVTMLGINMWIHQLTCNFKDDITNGRHTYSRGRRGPDRMLVGFTTSCAILPIATKVVSSNPVHGEVFSIQHYVIKFVWLVTGRWFSPGTPVSSTN